MDVLAKIKGIKYCPFLCRTLNEYSLSELDTALSKEGTFILNLGKNKQIALSCWVSPKRTRTYPYARVYDSLGFPGKRATIIPIIKDEGKDGDRDYLQWDTISLMSLLGVYTIISYYESAEKSHKYNNKITKQKYNLKHILEEINELQYYQSDALHWNLSRIEKAGELAQKGLDAYEKISFELGVEMHSKEFAKRRIKNLLEGKETFMKISRNLAHKAQERESITIQPKEKLTGTKATLTINNYLGGYYYFTCDEVSIENDTIYLIEGKHSKQTIIPSLEDIKDGLLKMILYTNLKEVKIGKLSPSQKETLKSLTNEAEKNKFKVTFNDTELKEITI
jgi:hypothetical protein